MLHRDVHYCKAAYVCYTFKFSHYFANPVSPEFKIIMKIYKKTYMRHCIQILYVGCEIILSQNTCKAELCEIFLLES